MLKVEATVQMNLYEALLPRQVLELNEELAKVDDLLDDGAITQPFIDEFAQAKRQAYSACSNIPSPHVFKVSLSTRL